MKIGFLQCGHIVPDIVARFGDYHRLYADLLADHEFSFQTWLAVDGILPARADLADGWLISGSRHGAYEDLDWIAPLEDFIRNAYAQGRPIVGICFGHQVLAQALGGTVEKSEKGWAVGARTYEMHESDPITINAWHQDQVVALPKDARVLGSSSFCPNAVVGYGDKALSYQGHPEFNAEFVDMLIEKRGRGVVPDILLDAAKASLQTPLSRAVVGAQIAEFFKTCRLP